MQRQADFHRQTGAEQTLQPERTTGAATTATSSSSPPGAAETATSPPGSATSTTATQPHRTLLQACKSDETHAFPKHFRETQGPNPDTPNAREEDDEEFLPGDAPPPKQSGLLSPDHEQERAETRELSFWGNMEAVRKKRSDSMRADHPHPEGTQGVGDSGFVGYTGVGGKGKASYPIADKFLGKWWSNSGCEGANIFDWQSEQGATACSMANGFQKLFEPIARDNSGAFRVADEPPAPLQCRLPCAGGHTGDFPAAASYVEQEPAA